MKKRLPRKQRRTKINTRSLKSLEYDKIIDILTGYAATPMGAELCTALQPSKNIDEVRQLLAETESGVKLLVCAGSPPLGMLTDIRPALFRLEKNGVLNNADLLGIAAMLRLARHLKSYAAGGRGRNANPEDNQDQTDESVSVKAIIETLFTDRRLEDEISSAIISDTEVSDDASPELRSIRRKISDNQNAIKDRLNEMIKSPRYQKFMQENLVTMRGDRYVVPVKTENRSDVPGIVHDTSSSGSTLFIEPMAVVEANNKIRELRMREQNEIQRILLMLTNMAVPDTEGLRANVATVARLDFIFAKAKFSLDYSCCVPEMNDKGIIEIRKGRHPLIPKDIVVPIDCRLGRDFKTLVVTGPNTGGKTVSLKTVGLFTLMAQSGLHVPAADFTHLAVFDGIYADIGDEQSIEQNLSTFSAHMSNLVDILANVTETSLVLLDELGAGTDPTEGAGLAMAILEHLNKLKCDTMATTHYSELKVFAATTPNVENACCEFNVETLRPTYKLLIGIPGKSNAFAISERLGLWKFIIDRAREFVTKDELKFEDLLMSIERSREQAERDRQEAETIKRRAEQERDEIKAQVEKLQEKKDKLMTDAKDNAKRLVSEAREELQDILDEARKLRNEYNAADFNKRSEELKQKTAYVKSSIYTEDDNYSEEQSGQPPDPSEVKPGAYVTILSLKSKGTVISAPDRSGAVTVQLGAAKMSVKLDDIRLITVHGEKKNDKKVKPSGGAYVMKSAAIRPQLDLRGMLVEEGIQELDKYLDDALMSGLSTVTVVHGKGTGSMRNGVHRFLKTHPRVKSYRLGSQGEGDFGVTIVELK